jgi:hypothetical protein
MLLCSVQAVVSVCCRYSSYSKLFRCNGIAHLLNQAVPQLRHLVTVLYPRRSGFVFRPWDLWWTNWNWGRGFSEYFYRYTVSVPHHSCSVLVFDLRLLWWRTWLRHCATSRKVASSIPGCVIGILNRHNHSSRTMALGSTQPLTEMSTRNISLGIKAAVAERSKPYHLHVATVLKSGSLNLLEPSGSVQVCNGTL